MGDISYGASRYGGVMGIIFTFLKKVKTICTVSSLLLCLGASYVKKYLPPKESRTPGQFRRWRAHRPHNGCTRTTPPRPVKGA
jgi:hypothetical protein